MVPCTILAFPTLVRVLSLTMSLEVRYQEGVENVGASCEIWQCVERMQTIALAM